MKTREIIQMLKNREIDLHFLISRVFGHNFLLSCQIRRNHDNKNLAANMEWEFWSLEWKQFD